MCDFFQNYFRRWMIKNILEQSYPSEFFLQNTSFVGPRGGAPWPNMFGKTAYSTYIAQQRLKKSFGKNSCFSLSNLVFSTDLAVEPFFTHNLLTSLWIGGLWSTFCEMLLFEAGPQNYCMGYKDVVIFAPSRPACLPTPPLLTVSPL